MIQFNNNKISLRQLQALLVLDLLGTSVITLPGRTAKVAGVDGWITVLIGGILLLGVLWLFITLLSRHPEETVVETMQRLLGRTAGFILSVSLALKLTITSGLELRMFSEILNQTMLARTPIWITAAVMVLLCLYLAAGGYECRGRAAEILFVLVIVPLLLLLAIVAFSVDYSQLKPVLGSNIGQLAKGSIIALFSFQGVEVLLLVYPYINNPRLVPKRLFAVGALIVFITTAITAVTIAWFGEISVKDKLFPVLSMLDSINLPGAFWNRQDMFMIWFWLASVFASVSAGIFFTGIIGERLFKTDRSYRFVFGATAVVFLTAILPKSAASASEAMGIVRAVGGGFYVIILPLILLILDYRQGRLKHDKV